MQFPRMAPVRQRFVVETLEDPIAEARRVVMASGLKERIHPGARVAVTAGSRGIYKIAEVTRTVVDCVRELGGEPFILPAMGSHGGGTVEGQREILASYGITEETMGVPVESTMDVVQVGEVEDGIPVVLNRLALEADGVVLINRVKPHTAFHGPFESGLMKMMTIGLGSHKGATLAHSMGASALPRMIPMWGKVILKEAPISLGVAIVENAYERTARLVAVEPEDFESVEPRLLHEAREWMPRLPSNRIDMLIVDRIGKNISGTGMDPNIIGRIWLPGIKEPDRPSVERIVVLDLTEETHGNANGIGLADVTTRRLVDRIDFKATYANALTTTFLNRVYVPVVGETEKEAVEIALEVLRAEHPEEARVVRIRSTLDLEHLWVSRSMIAELEEREDIEILGEPAEVIFDGQENLPPM